MDDLEFKVGDVVKHKTTDFKMVILQFVDGFDRPNPIKITCKYWDNKNEEFTTNVFYPFELELVTE